MASFDGVDFDNSQSESGVAHENVTNSDHDNTDTVKQGYSVSNPLYSSSLIGYWPLHEDSGTTVYDFSGDNNNYSISNASPNYSSILETTSWDFDGTGDYGTISSPYSNFSAASVSFWAYPHTASRESVPIGFLENNYFAVRSGDGSGNWYLDINGEGSTVSGPSTNTNNLQFVTATWDGSTAELYVNGSSYGTVSVSSLDNKGEGDDLGRRSNVDGYEDHYDGKLAEVRLYNRALTSSEVQTLYDVVNSSGTLQTQYKTI